MDSTMANLDDGGARAYRIGKDAYRISDAKALGCVAVTVLIYAVLCTVGLYGGSVLAYVLLVFPLGFVLQFFFNALHYCTHDTFVTSKPWNYALGVVFGCITVMNFALYRPYHLQHHKHLFTDKDPEPIDRVITSKLQYAFEMSAPLFFLDNWAQSIKTSIRTGIPNIFGREVPYLSETDRSSILANNVVLLAWLAFMVGMTAHFGSVVAWLYWLPLLVSFILANFVILPEHYQTDWVVGRNALNSRTIKAGSVTRFFLLGLNYHAEHHLYPAVPFHNLPRLNEQIGNEVRHRQTSYISFHCALWRSLPWRSTPASRCAG